MPRVRPQRHGGGGGLGGSNFEQETYARKEKVNILILYLLHYVSLFYIKTQPNKSTRWFKYDRD